MRHRASRPFVDLWLRLPRATATWLGAAAGHRPVRALAFLTVALGLGLGALVLPSVTGGPSTHRAEDPAEPIESGDAEGSAPTAEPSSPDDAGPSPSSTPSSTAGSGREPSASATDEGPRARRPGRGQVPASPSAETVTPSTAPEPSATASASPEDTTPPDTSLLEDFPLPDLAWFWFSSTEDGSFSCSLDGAAYAPCSSPTRYRDVEPGWHTLAVRAVDAAGNVDPTPAETRWLATAAPTDGG